MTPKSNKPQLHAGILSASLIRYYDSIVTPSHEDAKQENTSMTDVIIVVHVLRPIE